MHKFAVSKEIARLCVCGRQNAGHFSGMKCNETPHRPKMVGLIINNAFQCALAIPVAGA